MEKKDSLLMLKYMISEGFNPNNYERILELLQSAPLSLSTNLELVFFSTLTISNALVNFLIASLISPDNKLYISTLFSIFFSKKYI